MYQQAHHLGNGRQRALFSVLVYLITFNTNASSVENMNLKHSDLYIFLGIMAIEPHFFLPYRCLHYQKDILVLGSVRSTGARFCLTRLHFSTLGRNSQIIEFGISCSQKNRTHPIVLAEENAFITTDVRNILSNNRQSQVKKPEKLTKNRISGNEYR